MILEGSMEVEFCDGRRIQFHAGDGLYIESGLESRHRPVALTDEVRMVFVENLDP